MNIRKLSVIFQVVLWLATFILTIAWMFWPDPPFQPEPLTVAIGLVAMATTTLLSRYENKLKTEEFCIANALAVGYVNNFIEPVLTELIKKNKSPLFYIYIPAKISDLLPKNIDRLVSNLKESNLTNQTISIKLDEGRGARDVMTIFNTNGANVYFDFPNTLLTLSPLIDYKLESKKNSFNNAEKDELGRLYISKFKQTVEDLLTDKNLSPKYVQFTNSIDNINLK